VGGIVAEKLRQMLEDIAEFQADAAKQAKSPDWQVYDCSFFEAESRVDPGTVDLVVTSPPYMNNYHYVRNSRPQLFWTGLVASPAELKRLEQENFGKFWQTVRAEEPIHLEPKLPALEEELEEIRQINPLKGVYGGNGWANYICTYMNDLDRFCKLLVRLLQPGGTAIVVLGNSIVQGREIKVEECLCDIAKLNALAVVRVQKLRERTGSSIINSGARLHTRSKAPLYDAAVVLRRSC
jgi:methylase of polypeptide subunit release factors